MYTITIHFYQKIAKFIFLFFPNIKPILITLNKIYDINFEKTFSTILIFFFFFLISIVKFQFHFCPIFFENRSFHIAWQVDKKKKKSYYLALLDP